jgi:hypothetical protein
MLPLEWLKDLDAKVLTLAQIAVSSALALIGIVVSVIVGWFGYRNNFGWRPVVLIRTRSLSDVVEVGDAVRLSLEFEVLNRRNYQIRVDWLWSTFTNERPQFEGLAAGWFWLKGGQEFALEVGKIVEPSDSYRTKFEATFAATTLEEFYDDYAVEARYYDLRGNKARVARNKDRVDLRNLHKPIVIPAER